MKRAIAIVVFPGFQLLDAAGPVAVFEMAERFRPDSYTIEVLAPGGGLVRSSSGVSLAAAPIAPRRFDTVRPSRSVGARPPEATLKIQSLDDALEVLCA